MSAPLWSPLVYRQLLLQLYTTAARTPGDRNVSYQITLFQRKEVVIVAERKHQCVAREEFGVEAELQEEPVVVLTYTVVYPGKERHTHTSVRCSHQGQEGKPLPNRKANYLKIHIYKVPSPSKGSQLLNAVAPAAQ